MIGDTIPTDTPMSPSTVSTTSSNATTTTIADDHRLLERSVSSPTHTTDDHSHDHHCNKLPPLRLLSNESDDRSTIAPLSDSPRALLIQSTPVKKLGHRRAFSTDLDLYVFHLSIFMFVCCSLFVAHQSILLNFASSNIFYLLYENFYKVSHCMFLSLANRSQYVLTGEHHQEHIVATDEHYPAI